MSDITQTLSSGKGHADENFPVASMLVAPLHRDVVMKFYAVARMADDVADHATAAPAEKLAGLAAIEASLLGREQSVAAAVALRDALLGRAITTRHMLDLLEAFRRDVVKSRYADWAELMDYCRYSAAPVGRFMLDVHGESPSTWPASDALCAALQMINHLQDCGKDYREIDRIYVPLDALAAADLEVAALGAARAAPALLTVLGALARRTQALLHEARPLRAMTRDLRLALEIGVIHSLAEDLVQRLKHRDPLSQRVHHRKHEALGFALSGAVGVLAGRLFQARGASGIPQA